MLSNINKLRCLLYTHVHLFLIYFGGALTSKETPPFQIILDNVLFICDDPIICKTYIDQSDNTS